MIVNFKFIFVKIHICILVLFLYVRTVVIIIIIQYTEGAKKMFTYFKAKKKLCYHNKAEFTQTENDLKTFTVTTVAQNAHHGC